MNTCDSRSSRNGWEVDRTSCLARVLRPVEARTSLVCRATCRVSLDFRLLRPLDLRGRSQGLVVLYARRWQHTPEQPLDPIVS